MSDPAADGLAACLSRLLVACTIELDNEFEQHMPHRTALFGPGGPEPVLPSSGRPFRAPWLASIAMWQNGLRYVPAEGVPASSLRGLGAKISGLQRWGYLRPAAAEETAAAEDEPAGRADPVPAGPVLAGSVLADPVLRPTAAGRYAHAVWRPAGGAGRAPLAAAVRR